MASVVVESIPPLKRTTAGFIYSFDSARFSEAMDPFVGAPGGRALPVSSAIAADSLFIRVLDTNGERDSAAGGELRGYDRLSRRACFYEIVENPVGHRFVKGAFIPV